MREYICTSEVVEPAGEAERTKAMQVCKEMVQEEFGGQIAAEKINYECLPMEGECCSVVVATYRT